MESRESVPSPEQLLEELRESRNSWQQSFLADDGKRRFLEAVKAVENCLAAAHPQNECCRYWIARLHLAEACLKLAKAELADELSVHADRKELERLAAQAPLPQVQEVPQSDERELFEEWARHTTADDPLDFTPCNNPSCRCGFHYVSPATAWAYEAFRFGRRHRIGGGFQER